MAGNANANSIPFLATKGIHPNVDPVDDYLFNYLMDGNDLALTNVGGEDYRSFDKQAKPDGISKWHDGTQYATANGDSDKVAIGTGAFSISFWYNTYASGVETIISNGSNYETVSTEFAIRSRGATGKVQFYSGTQVSNSSSFGILNDGNWHFVVMTSTGAGGDFIFNIDGVAQAAETSPSYNISDTGVLWIGAQPGPDREFGGGIDDVRFYDRVLSPTEISCLYNYSYNTTPNTISTPEIWLNPSDQTTITASSGDVSQFNDKSGNDRHVLQGNSLLQPVTGSNDINGINALTFVRANLEQMQTTGAATWLNGTEIHIFTVVDSATALGNQYYCGTVQNANNKGMHVGYFSSSTIGIDFFNDQNVCTVTRNTSPTIHYMSYTQPGSDYYENGTKNVGSSTTNPVNDLNTDNPFGFGMGYRITADTWDGDIGDLYIITGSLTDAKRQDLEGYIAWKYGLVASLPVGHDHKTTPVLIG